MQLQTRYFLHKKSLSVPPTLYNFSPVGWMYEFALEEQQRYKESHVILEKALIKEKDGIEEEIFNT